MGIRIDFLDGDDWFGIYVDCECVWQDHQLSPRLMFEFLQEWQGQNTEPAFYYEADANWIDEIGHFPKKLEDCRTTCSKGMTLGEFWEK